MIGCFQTCDIKQPVAGEESIVKMKKDQICIVIPSFNPNQKLLELLESLTQNGYNNIILVNDGSTVGDIDIFQIARDKYQCHLLQHYVNQGKGRALKAAFNYFMEYFPDKAGVITVDSDGQHQVKDVDVCAESLLENPGKLTLGCRDFDRKNVPFRSKFGNILTRNVFSTLCGIKISDTQTGLRAIPIDLIPIFLSTKGERFEYEMNMLIDCKQHHIEFKEVPIQTIYFEKNTSSHFNPILDSVRIYMVFLKFIASSFSSFLIDIILFIALTFLLKGAIPRSYILVATILARIISSAFNYLNNKRYVFKSLWKSRFTLPKYYVLAVVQMLCSAFLVGTLHGTL